MFFFIGEYVPMNRCLLTIMINTNEIDKRSSEIVLLTYIYTYHCITNYQKNTTFDILSLYFNRKRETTGCFQYQFNITMFFKIIQFFFKNPRIHCTKLCFSVTIVLFQSFKAEWYIQRILA